MQYSDGINTIWNPCDLLVSNHKTLNYAILILNRPIRFKFDSSFLLHLWTQAHVRVTVDGGTGRWLSWLKGQNLDVDKIMAPDLITGDMDSLSLDTIEFFNKKGCRIVKTPDQNETDFTKALKVLMEHCTRKNITLDAVYVIADTSGRFDQIIANINTLYKGINILLKVPVFLLASNSLTWILLEGRHKINIPNKLRESSEWCALIPFKSTPCVSTTGLKWNLDNSRMEFGALVSTSNTYDGSPIVTVNTDQHIIWSMGIENLTSPR